MTLVNASLDQAAARLLASEPDALRDPFPVWQGIRESGPIYRHGGATLVTRYADVRPLLKDVRLSNRYTSDGTRAAAINARLDEKHRALNREVSEFEGMYMNRQDGDDHARLRNTVHRVFTARRMAELGENVNRYVEEAFDEAATQDVTDFCTQVAARIPMMVLVDLLGVPQSDRDLMHAWSSHLALNRGGEDPVALRAAHKAMSEFRAYVEEEVIPSRRQAGGSELVRALLDAEGAEHLTPHEVTAQFVLLLFSGFETTANLLSIGLLELLRRRDQWDRICQEPGLVPNAVEELLRWVSPAQFIGRVTREPMDIGGERVEQGETLFLLLAGANHDPEVFEDPERIDVARENARAHVAFGLGPHFCLGNALTRIEADAVFAQLVKRFPDIQLLDDDPPFGSNAMMRSPSTLAVRVGADYAAS